MRDDDALWCSCRSRGVDDVGGVLRGKAAAGGRGGMPRDGIRISVEANDVAAVGGKPSAQMRLRHQYRCSRIRKHEPQPLARIAGVERKIRTTSLEDADEPNEHLQRALNAQPNHHLRPNPQPTQVMRHTVRPRIKLAVAQSVSLEHRSRRLRRLRNLRRKQLRQRRRSNRTIRRVPLPQDPVPLTGAQHSKLANRTIRLRYRPLQHTDQPIRYRLNTRTLKQVAGIFQRTNNPASTTVRTPPLRNAHRQVKLRAPARYLLSNRLQPT